MIRSEKHKVWVVKLTHAFAKTEGVLYLEQVAYIDTEGTFRPERIRPIAERFELDAEAVLDNVRCVEALMRLLELVCNISALHGLIICKISPRCHATR